MERITAETEEQSPEDARRVAGAILDRVVETAAHPEAKSVSWEQQRRDREELSTAVREVGRWALERAYPDPDSWGYDRQPDFPGFDLRYRLPYPGEPDHEDRTTAILVTLTGEELLLLAAGLRESIDRQWFWIANPDHPRFADLGMSPGSRDRRDALFDEWLLGQVLLHAGSRELARGLGHADDSGSHDGIATTEADSGGGSWCEEGWEPETVLELAERFIGDRGLKVAFDDYLQVVAEEEQDMSADDEEDQ